MCPACIVRGTRSPLSRAAAAAAATDQRLVFACPLAIALVLPLLALPIPLRSVNQVHPCPGFGSEPHARAHLAVLPLQCADVALHAIDALREAAKVGKVGVAAGPEPQGGTSA